MGTPVKTEIYLEIEAQVSGTFLASYAATGPTYDCGGEPGEPERVEDASVDGVFIEREVITYPEPGVVVRRTDRVDMLAGLDPKAREIVCANIMAAYGETQVAASLLEDMEVF